MKQGLAWQHGGAAAGTTAAAAGATVARCAAGAAAAAAGAGAGVGAAVSGGECRGVVVGAHPTPSHANNGGTLGGYQMADGGPGGGLVGGMLPPSHCRPPVWPSAFRLWAAAAGSQERGQALAEPPCAAGSWARAPEAAPCEPLWAAAAADSGGRVPAAARRSGPPHLRPRPWPLLWASQQPAAGCAWLRGPHHHHRPPHHCQRHHHHCRARGGRGPGRCGASSWVLRQLQKGGRPSRSPPYLRASANGDSAILHVVMQKEPDASLGEPGNRVGEVNGGQ